MADGLEEEVRALEREGPLPPGGPGEGLLARVYRLAVADWRGLFAADGTLKPIGEMPADAACLVAGLEVRETWSEPREDGTRVQTGRVVKVRLRDTLRAEQVLARYTLTPPGRDYGELKKLVELMQAAGRRRVPGSGAVVEAARARLLGAGEVVVEGLAPEGLAPEAASGVSEEEEPDV